MILVLASTGIRGHIAISKFVHTVRVLYYVVHLVLGVLSTVLFLASAARSQSIREIVFATFRIRKEIVERSLRRKSTPIPCCTGYSPTLLDIPTRVTTLLQSHHDKQEETRCVAQGQKAVKSGCGNHQADLEKPYAHSK